MDKKTILVVGAHMDDCEIGAGGLIIKAVRKGHRVVLVNVATDYSTWCVTKGREEEVKAKVLNKAKETKVEKRLLGYGYQSIVFCLETLRKMAEIILEVKPDITFLHNRFERSPSDHAIVSEIAEYAVRNANTLLGGKDIHYGKEMYSYEVYPGWPFQPDTFIEISDVIEEVIEPINYFGRLYGDSPYAGKHPEYKKACSTQGTIKIENKEIPLRPYGELKLATAKVRGCQCGVRFAEAYVALQKNVIGKSALQEMVMDIKAG